VTYSLGARKECVRWTTTARLHYAWVILAVTCLTVVLTAGVTAVPAVLIHPLEVTFGWDRAAIALAVSINVFLYGLAGPFAGRLMLRVGPRRVMLTSLLCIAAGVAAATQIQTVLHLYLLWGVVVGVGTGSTALVLSATVVNRWFTTRRGLALGLLGAASSTGRLVFLPLLAMIVTALGWQAVGWVVAGGLLLLAVPFVALLMRDAPAALGLTPWGVAPFDLKTSECGHHTLFLSRHPQPGGESSHDDRTGRISACLAMGQAGAREYAHHGCGHSRRGGAVSPGRPTRALGRSGSGFTG
jgi:MFS family permease